jgi:Sporulation and spore germination
MIPRYQRILFWSLLGGILLMAAFLLRGCEQAHTRLSGLSDDATPIAAPTSNGPEDVTLYIASDAEGSITPTTSHLALPQDPTVRARVLLEHLLAQYSLANSTHSLQSGSAIADVFLLSNPPPGGTGQLAVINLRGSFIANHPAGILTEDLTVQSIIGTLHSALPQVTKIRFLVDGQPHDTLAGHADLRRTYSAIDTTTKPSPPTQEATQP